MAIKNLKKLDQKLSEIYQNQMTTAVAPQEPFVDRSELLFQQLLKVYRLKILMKISMKMFWNV